MHLDGVSIPTGGFGRMPADKAMPRQSGDVIVDDAPQLEEAKPEPAAPAFGSVATSF